MSTIERAIDKLGRTGQGGSVDSDVENQQQIPGQVQALDQASQARENESQKTQRANEGSQSRIHLDFSKLRQAGMVTPDAERSQIAEEFRHIKRPLLLNAFGEAADCSQFKLKSHFRFEHFDH